MTAEARLRTQRAAIDARRREAQPALASILGGLLWALVGFVLGVAITALVRTIAGASAWSFEQSFAVGYVFALSGWLLGVGVWDRWALEWLGRPVKPGVEGWKRYLAFTTDHKVIGVQYLVTFLTLFLLAGLFAMLIRLQLLSPDGAVLDNDIYNRTMSLHGIIMVAVAVAVVIGGGGDDFSPPLPARRGGRPLPRQNPLLFLAAPAGSDPAAGGAGRRRLGLRLDGLPAAQRDERPRPDLLQPGDHHLRPLVHPGRAELPRDRHLPAGAGHDLDAAADLRLVDRGRGDPGADLHAVLRRGDALGHAGPHRRHVLLQGGGGRRPPPLPARLLVLLPPGGLHLRPAGLRPGPGGAEPLRAQAALRLSLGGGRPPRHRRHERDGLGAPHVRQRHEQHAAGALPGDDGDHLGADGV